MERWICLMGLALALPSWANAQITGPTSIEVGEHAKLFTEEDDEGISRKWLIPTQKNVRSTEVDGYLIVSSTEKGSIEIYCSVADFSAGADARRHHIVHYFLLKVGEKVVGPDEKPSKFGLRELTYSVALAAPEPDRQKIMDLERNYRLAAESTSDDFEEIRLELIKQNKRVLVGDGGYWKRLAKEVDGGRLKNLFKSGQISSIEELKEAFREIADGLLKATRPTATSKANLSLNEGSTEFEDVVRSTRYQLGADAAGASEQAGAIPETGAQPSPSPGVPFREASPVSKSRIQGD